MAFVDLHEDRAVALPGLYLLVNYLYRRTLAYRYVKLGYVVGVHADAAVADPPPYAEWAIGAVDKIGRVRKS